MMKSVASVPKMRLKSRSTDLYIRRLTLKPKINHLPLNFFIIISISDLCEARVGARYLFFHPNPSDEPDTAKLPAISPVIGIKWR